ncbi:MAG: SDR family NAD(P)-dependent oxidoreductase [Silicimonas sp.]|nr:SDR family NAD(P)-dependent oxidoreductase [Silicimonas sp.]
MSTELSNSGFSDWKPDQLSDLTGRTYVITGANSGLGFEASKMLAAKGANIAMLCRSAERSESARNTLAQSGTGSVDVVEMDLSDLTSVRNAAVTLRSRVSKIDGLVNNAGIMNTPEGKTKDGFELQFGTNHLGPFLWTGLLIDLVEAAAGRVVVVTSAYHKKGQINIDNLMLTGEYSPAAAYEQSKLANLMFAIELDRRLKTAGSVASCIACHPGFASTSLQDASTGLSGFLIKHILNRFIAQPAQAGAVPMVLAAAGTEAQPGGFYGPQKGGEMRGPVSDASAGEQALDEDMQARLWAESERLVGFEWKPL